MSVQHVFYPADPSGPRIIVYNRYYIAQSRLYLHRPILYGYLHLSPDPNGAPVPVVLPSKTVGGIVDVRYSGTSGKNIAMIEFRVTDVVHSALVRDRYTV